jgi:autotransporter family porin
LNDLKNQVISVFPLAKNLLPIFFLFLTLTFAFMVFADDVSAAPGDNIYVNDSSGNDSSDGYTWDTAKKTILNASVSVNENGVVNIANGQYSGTGNTNITISNNMTITGQSTDGTIINGLNSGNLFNVIPGISLTLRNLTLTGGNTTDNGGAVNNQGILTIENCKITDNTANDGGGVYNTGNCILNDSTISGNTADRSGGGICNYRGICTVTSCIITQNTATNFRGAGIYNQGNCTVNDCIITLNTAIDNSGGGIENDGPAVPANGTIIVTKCIIQDNKATNGAGISNHMNCIISDCNILNNTATLYGGGGIFNYNYGTCTVTSCNIIQNTAKEVGGAISNYNDCFVHFTRFFNNHATLNGTAIWDNTGDMNATNNWWGSNENPISISNLIVIVDDGTVCTDPWLILTISANPTNIPYGSTSTVTASVTTNSNGEDTSSQGHIPDGTPITITTDIGNVGSKQVTVPTVAGIATATLRANEGYGLATLYAMLDGFWTPLPANVVITQAASTTTVKANTVGMQTTGAPIAGMALAILMVIGGLFTARKK